LSTDTLNTGIAVLAFAVSLVALWFALQAFLLKAGQRIRGSFDLTSTVDCDDTFVSSVTLENLKDRAVVVFGIYLQISNGYFLELEDLGSSPLVLQPFEVVHRDYEPIDHYSVGVNRIDINRLLTSRGIRRRLVLATPNGPYGVREPVRQWDPVGLFFGNHLTAILRPRRARFEGRAYGTNVRYLVRLRMSGGAEKVVPLRERDYEIMVFRKFAIPREALASSTALEEFLLARAVEGGLRCEDLTVHDLQDMRAEAFDDGEVRKKIVAVPRSWATYYLQGRLYTWWSNYKMHRANRRHHAARLAGAKAKNSRGAGPVRKSLE
jgi:hypothetical protein